MWKRKDDSRPRHDMREKVIDRNQQSIEQAVKELVEGIRELKTIERRSDDR